MIHRTTLEHCFLPHAQLEIKAWVSFPLRPSRIQLDFQPFWPYLHSHPAQCRARLYVCQRQPSPIAWDDSKMMSSRVLFQYIWNIRVSGWRNLKKPDCQQSRSGPTCYLQVGAILKLILWRCPEKPPNAWSWKRQNSRLLSGQGVLSGFGSGLIGIPARACEAIFLDKDWGLPKFRVFQNFTPKPCLREPEFEKYLDAISEKMWSSESLPSVDILEWKDRTYVDIWLQTAEALPRSAYLDRDMFLLG